MEWVDLGCNRVPAIAAAARVCPEEPRQVESRQVGSLPEVEHPVFLGRRVVAVGLTRKVEALVHFPVPVGLNLGFRAVV